MARLISLSELIDRVWEQYRASLLSFLTISGWVLFAGLFYLIALALYPTVDQLVLTDTLTTGQTVGVLLFALTRNVLAPIIALWAFIACVRFGSAQLERGRGDLPTAFRQGWKSFLPTLATTVLFIGLLFAAFLITIGPGFVLSVFTTGRFDAGWVVLTRNLLVVIGVLASVYFSIRWFVEYQFTPLISALGDKKPLDAFAASRTLLKGRFWAVAIRSLAPKLVFVLLGAAGLWVLSTVSSVGLSMLSGFGLPFVARLGSFLSIFFGWVLYPMFILPLLYLCDVHLYRSLKETV